MRNKGGGGGGKREVILLLILKVLDTRLIRYLFGFLSAHGRFELETCRPTGIKAIANYIQVSSKIMHSSVGRLVHNNGVSNIHF